MARIEDVARVNITIIDCTIVALSGGTPVVNIADLIYNPGSPGNWIGVPPTDGADALDRLAGRTLTLENVVASLPPQHSSQTVADAAARLALTPIVNDIVVQNDDASSWIWSGAVWIRLDGNAGTVTLVPSAVERGLLAPVEGDIAVQVDDNSSWAWTSTAWIRLNQDRSEVSTVANAAARILTLTPERGDIAVQSDDSSSWVWDGTQWVRLDGLSPDLFNVADAAARTALTPKSGDFAIQADDSSTWIYDGTVWAQLGGPTADPNVLIYDDVGAARAAGAPTNTEAMMFTRRVLGGTLDLQPESNGPFFWDATATNADDTGMFIQPTGVTGAGRWRRGDAYGDIKATWFGIQGGQANATADSAALRAAWDYVVGRSTARGNLSFRLPNGEVFYNDPVALFSGHTGLANGISIVGTASRQSNDGTKIVLDGPALHWYDNGSTGKGIGLVFEKIIFDGNDRDGAKGTILFNMQSNGTEQFFTWRDCMFFRAWGGINLTGGSNNAEHRWDACQWVNCGGSVSFDGYCTRVDNPQAVSNHFTNCDWVLNFGHIMTIGPTGGGGNWRIQGGSCIGSNEVTQLPQYVIHAVGATGLAPSNNRMVVEMKLEPRTNLRLIQSDSNIDVDMTVNIVGDTFGGAAARETVDISGSTRLTLRGTMLSGATDAMFRVGGTPSNAFSTGSSLVFKNCIIPHDIFSRVIVDDNGQWHIGDNCQTPMGFQPSAVATGLSLPIIHRTAIGYSSPNPGTTSVSQPRRYTLSLDGVSNNASPGGAGAPIYVLLPPGVLLHRVYMQKPASGSAAIPFQLGATIGVSPATAQQFYQTPVQFQREEVVVDFDSIGGLLIGPTEAERVLVIDTVNGNDGIGELHALGRAYVEYSCP